MPKSVPIPDEAAWLAIRESHIGGSEVASLFYRWRLPDGEEAVRHLFEEVPQDATLLECLSPYKTGFRLWQEKAGRLAPDSFSENERVQAGTFLEPALAEWSGQKFGWKIRKVRRYLQHDDVGGWGASLDYELHGDGMSGVPVEFKNVDGGMFRRDWMLDGEDIVLPPINYLLQVQHQMGASGADHGWIVACVGGNQLRRGRIERHEATQAKIAEAISTFWQAVKAGVEPVRVADYESVAKAYAVGDKAAAADLSSNPEVPVLCGQYLRLKRHIERVETRSENIKGRIAAAVGEATKATTSGYKISWPTISRPEKVIPERVQAALTYRGGLTITRVEA